jgi:hypothetical protein
VEDVGALISIRALSSFLLGDPGCSELLLCEARNDFSVFPELTALEDVTLEGGEWGDDGGDCIEEEDLLLDFKFVRMFDRVRFSRDRERFRGDESRLLDSLIPAVGEIKGLLDKLVSFVGLNAMLL